MIRTNDTAYGLLRLYQTPSYALMASHPNVRLLEEAMPRHGDGYVVRDVIALRKVTNTRSVIVGIEVQQYSANMQRAQRYLNASLWWLARDPFSLRRLPVTLIANGCSSGIVRVHGGDVAHIDISRDWDGSAPAAADLLSVATRLPRLVSLDVSGAPHSRAGLRTVRHGHLLQGCEQLRRLAMRHTALTTLAVTVPLQNLQVLDVSGCAHLTDLSPLTRARFLVELNVGGTAIGEIEALRHCPTLRKVVLDCCAALSDLSPLEDCPFLETVLASSTAVVHIQFVRRCKALRTLDVRFCTNLHDLLPLTALPHLTEVRARGSGVKFVMGLDSCPCLTRLDLHGTACAVLSREARDGTPTA